MDLKGTENQQSKIVNRKFLPRQFQRKLQLSWIKRRSGLLAAIPQWVDVRNVEAVDEVERVNQPFQGHALAQRYSLAQTNVSENVHGLGSGIAPQVAIQGSIEEACGL